MKQVKIDIKLLKELYLYFCVPDMQEMTDINYIKNELCQKWKSAVARELYTKIKTSHSDDERKKLLADYHDLRK